MVYISDIRDIVFITLCECTVFMLIALDIFIVVASCFY